MAINSRRPDLSAEFEKILSKALAKNVGARYHCYHLPSDGLEAHLRVSQIDAWLFKNLDKIRNYFYLTKLIFSSQRNSTARSTHIEKPILI
ncbi:MAG: hypothetical protein O7G31_06735 [Calditrichaeota bacterium]|nr:hypothetical protein [Calditrichota bacterium]